MVNSLPKNKAPRSVQSPFTVVISKNVFCQGMVVLLNPVCILLLECFMFIRAKYMMQFLRRDDLQNIGFDPALENRRIVWTFIFEAAGSKEEGSISYNYRFHIVTHFKS